MDGDGCAYALRIAIRGIGGRDEAGAQPLSFDKANHLTGLGGNDGSTALAAPHFMVEEEQFGFAASAEQLRKLEIEDLAGGAVVNGRVQGVRVEGLCRIESCGEHGAALREPAGGQRQESDFV